jgi:hypothetical protein
MSRTHCQQGKNTGATYPQWWGGNKRWVQRPEGEEGGRGEPPPFCLARGEWKKNVSHRVNRWPFFFARHDNDQWFSCWNTTFLSVRKIVATQTFISSSGKNKLFKKTDPCFFKDNYFLKNLYWFFCHLRVSEVIQVWHTLTPKNYMRFWMSVFWCFILGPSGGFLNYFFWMRCHAGRIPIVNREKNTGPRTPPPAKKR